MYPPALEALEEVREQCADRVREGEGDREAFHDFVAINRVLGEEGRTWELFAWLDTNLPGLATELLEIAQPALLQTKDYGLCGRHLDPDLALQRLRGILQARNQFAHTRAVDQRFVESSQRNYMADAATVVALLMLNDRTADAERILAQALIDYDTPQFRDLLARALRGEVPQQRR